jgi:hypothetical protein
VPEVPSSGCRGRSRISDSHTLAINGIHALGQLGAHASFRDTAIARIRPCPLRDGLPLSPKSERRRRRDCAHASPRMRARDSAESRLTPSARVRPRGLGSSDHGGRARSSHRQRASWQPGRLRLGDSTSAAAAPWVGDGVANRACGRWSIRPWKHASGRWSETRLSPNPGHDAALCRVAALRRWAGDGAVVSPLRGSRYRRSHEAGLPGRVLDHRRRPAQGA